MQISKRNLVKIVLIVSIILLIGVTIKQAQTTKSSQNDKTVSKSKSNSVAEKTYQNSNQNNDGNIGNKKYIRQVYTYLNGEYGLSATSIAGILGNWIQESGIDPIAVQGDWTYRSLKNAQNSTDDNKDIGFAQWSYKRRQNLVTFANQKYHGHWWEALCQLEFMTQQDGSFVAILKNYALNDSDDVVKNAVDFNDDWEVSPDEKNKVETTRGKNAQLVYQYMQKNKMISSADRSKIQKLVYLGNVLPY